MTPMCDICHRAICPSACPNARDPVVGRCAICGGRVYASEPRVKLAGGTVCHHDCLRTLTPEEWLDGFGVDYEREGCP